MLVGWKVGLEDLHGLWAVTTPMAFVSEAELHRATVRCFTCDCVRAARLF